MPNFSKEGRSHNRIVGRHIFNDKIIDKVNFIIFVNFLCLITSIKFQIPDKLPQSESAVPATGNRIPTIRGEGDRTDPTGVPLQGAQTLAGLKIPHSEGFVPAYRNRIPPVRGEGDRIDTLGMTLQSA